MSNIFSKITHGYVKQDFNDLGECISQEFVASCDSDSVEYEHEHCEINRVDMPLCGDEYHPFDMVQPSVGDTTERIMKQLDRMGM
jgi:hypothetical protein